MDMKRDYYEDVQLFKSGVVLFWTSALLILLFTIPLYAPNYYIYLLNSIMVHVILAVGLNILAGSTGQISLGHAGFFAIGAYGTAMLMSSFQVPFFLAIVIAVFVAAFFGCILGLPALRLEGPYLAIASLGFGLTIMHIIGAMKVFGGRMGMKTPPLDLGIAQLGFSLPVTNDMQKYYLILVITVVMVVVGGLGTVSGSIMGATLITYLQYDFFKNIAEVPYFGKFMLYISDKWFTTVGLENFSSMAIGLIMIGIIIFEPLGMFGVWIRFKKYWMTSPFYRKRRMIY